MVIDPEDHPSVSDWESDSESDGYERGLDLDKLLEMDEWKEFGEQEDQEDLISHEEMLSADEEAGLWDCRNQTLTEQDRDNIAASHLKLISNMPRVAFGQMHHTFRRKLESNTALALISTDGSHHIGTKAAAVRHSAELQVSEDGV
ncbi:hypothetical protein B0H14DRAFT_2598729 [Mycena olivaceomarginata]|nr:hypothetical protein B0H14DRAFT_2598724 [Mycena olivaceomarginata]KAJ7822217.1 hypothetical protein B0H14DRAFT_2598729 [Mycena olivaceomarginata]